MIRLSQLDIKEDLKNLPGWNVINEKLHKEFEFDSFNQAFGFMTSSNGDRKNESSSRVV